MMLDHVIHLIAQSEQHHMFTAVHITRCIIPPVNLYQCVYLVENGVLVGWASWAFMPRNKADLFLDGEYKLSPIDWRSGDVPVFMDFVAPFGHAMKLHRKCRELFPKLSRAEWRRHAKSKRVGVNLYVK